ncbi:MAG: DNA double-strand break repair nuclease NurA [Chloroflexota bacterium]
MAIDFQQIYTKIKEIGAGARERKKTLEERRSRARDLLSAYASELDALRIAVDAAKRADPSLRCALPLDEALASSCPPPDSVPQAILIAADGSQINPDRHAATQFCLINVGALVMQTRSGAAPEIHTHSELLYGDELDTQTGVMTEGMVALRRDLKERSQLEELSRDMDGAVVTFTDGPIELWGARDGEDAKAYLDALDNYKSVLSRLQARGVITAGYVDKPSANLVVRLLEIASASVGQDAILSYLRNYHPLRGVSDRWLFGEKSAPLLPPGHRSAVFGIQSKSEKDYQGALSLRFFYLNVGADAHPWPARVEIPKWVADDREKLDLLHAVLVEQCRMMGSKPYPYLLHRAHEVAVVRQEEKYQVEQMLAQELRRQDEELDDGSYKQSAKDLPGRTRR